MLRSRTRLLDGTARTSRISNVRSMAKSVQSGTITVVAAATTGTVTITGIDTANSLLYLNGWSYATSTLAIAMAPRIDLTNSTTITATIAIAVADNTLVNFTIVEYWPGVIRRIQRGTVTLNTVTSNTATITAVDITNAVLNTLGFSANTGGNNNVSFYPKLVLTNSTTITATLGLSAAFDVIAGYQVVEYY